MEMTQKASRAAYMREYRKRHPSRAKRLTLTLSHADYARFREQAATHGLTLAAYIVSLAFVAVCGKPLLSKNAENKLVELIGNVRRCGNNINQIAHHVNAVHKLSLGEAREVKKLMGELEDLITAFFKNPDA